jgi:hypothetical protein
VNWYICKNHGVLLTAHVRVNTPIFCATCNSRLEPSDTKPVVQTAKLGLLIKRDETLLDCVEASRVTGIHERTIQRWAKNKMLGGATQDQYTKRWRIPLGTVQSLMQERDSSKV